MTRSLAPSGQRLAAIAAAIPAGSRVADIGSDHGRLPRLLIATGRADHCVATEHGAGPLGRLRDSVASSPHASRIEIRGGDGLEPLRPDDDLDTLVLAGMGGPRMLRILASGRLAGLGVTQLVLQPQSGWAGLRAGLDELGCGVYEERLVLDRGRFYTVMRARPNASSAPAAHGFTRREWYELGPCWRRDREPVVVAYWAWRGKCARRRLEQARGHGVAVARAECELSDRALSVFSGAAVRLLD